MNLPSLLVFLACILTSASPQRYSKTEYTLYGPEDRVIVLNSMNIKEQIYGSDRAWFVEYFANWCPHCQRFAPLYKEFAQDVWDWRNIVGIAALDCAQGHNTGTCREFQVHSYPTLRFFPPRSPQFTDSYSRHIGSTFRGIPIEKSEELPSLKQDLIDQLELYYPKLLRMSNNSHLANDPLQLLRATNELQFPVQPTAAVVIFESPTSYTGKEVALKLSLHKFIKVYRFGQSNHLYHAMRLNTWPAAGVITSDGALHRIEIGSRNWVETITASVLRLAGVQRIEPRTTTPRAAGTTPPPAIQPRSGSENRSDIVSMDDMLHALRDTLHREIPIVNVIEGEKLKALRNFLNVLTRFFPADRREIRTFFRLLHRWVLSRDQIQATDFVATLQRLENRFRPWDGVNLNEWDDCRGTIPGKRGYTCGLWRLFHTLTIIPVQRNSNEGALNAIHAYVKEFFGCTDCRQHFTAMVSRDGILAQRSPVSQALWLWRAHNEVNQRTKGTHSEDPGYPKSRYPSQRLCPECYDANGNFVESRVLDYLLRIYTRPRRSQHRNLPQDTFVSPRRGYRNHQQQQQNRVWRGQSFVPQGYVRPRPYAIRH